MLLTIGVPVKLSCCYVALDSYSYVAKTGILFSYQVFILES